MRILYISLIVVCLGAFYPTAVDGESSPRSTRKPKNPLYMTEMDMDTLYQQWEDSDDEKLPPDELEPHKRPPPTIDKRLLESKNTDPETLMRLSKRGKTVMAFLNLASNISRKEADELTSRWQVGLRNAHVRVERFVIEDNRVMFVFEDGYQAYEFKDYLLDQPELSEYVIEGRSFHGKGYPVEYPHAEL